MRNKRIAVALLVLLMIGALAFPAFARGPKCIYCKDGELKFVDVTYTRWETEGFPKCPINPNYTDKEQTRWAHRTWRCNDCGAAEVISSLETRVLCGH